MLRINYSMPSTTAIGFDQVGGIGQLIMQRLKEKHKDTLRTNSIYSKNQDPQREDETYNLIISKA